jgi:hypothetical protein
MSRGQESRRIDFMSLNGGEWLRFAGGQAEGPNGQYGAWEVVVDGAFGVTVSGRSLGSSFSPAPGPLDADERAALEALLPALEADDVVSKRNGVPGEALLQLAVRTPSGVHKGMVWHREAQGRPHLAPLLRWIDGVVSARAGLSPLFGA